MTFMKTTFLWEMEPVTSCFSSRLHSGQMDFLADRVNYIFHGNIDMVKNKTHLQQELFVKKIFVCKNIFVDESIKN